MTFHEMKKDLQTFLKQKQALDRQYAEDKAKAEQRFKGEFLTQRLNERKAEHDSELYALRSRMKADIEALRAEKIALADKAATKAPSQETMMLLQALSLRKSVSKTEVLTLAEAIKENYPALAALRDIAADKGYLFEVTTPEQVKQRIDAAYELALRAIDGALDLRSEATMFDREGMIELYNEAEQRRDVALMVQIDAQIKGGVSVWDSVTAQLDAGYINTPTVTRIITPGEKELIKRMFDGVPADRLKDTVNQKAADPETRELISLSDFASLLEAEDK